MENIALKRKKPIILGNPNFADKALVFLLIWILSTLDYSIQVSIVSESKPLTFSPWLIKFSYVSISDVIIVFLAIYSLIRSVMIGVTFTPYFLIPIVSFIYLIMGIFYNLFVFFSIKPWLFELKFFLCLTAPYIFLMHQPKDIIKHFSINRLILYFIIANMLDWIWVNMFGVVEEVSAFGLPVLPLLIPPIFPYVLMTRSGQIYKPYFFIFVISLINIFSRLELYLLLNFITSLLTFEVIYKPIIKSFKSRLYISAILFFFIHALSVIFVAYNPFLEFLDIYKNGGVGIRHSQWLNAINDFGANIFSLVGHGLGTTWYEVIPIDDPTGYSYGNSVEFSESGGFENTRLSPVKYIFNWVAPVIFYRWGGLGVLLLIGVITNYALSQFSKVSFLHNKNDRQYAIKIISLNVCLLYETMSFHGWPLMALFVSIMSFNVDNFLQSQSKHFSRNI